MSWQSVRPPHPFDVASAMNAAVVIPIGSINAVLRQQVDRVLGQAGASLVEVVLSVNSARQEVASEVQSIVDSCNDERLRVVDSSDHKGAAHARNVGAAAVGTEVVAFCDADDLVHDGWLAALIDGLGKFDAVSGRVVDVFPEERMRNWYPPTTSGDLSTFLGRPYLLTGNLAIRRRVFEAVGGFDESLTRCEDIAISWSLVRAGYTIGYVDAAAIDYRHRSGLVAMLRQHYSYGRGMSEVLRAVGTPISKMLRPNRQRAGRRSIVGVLRRGAIAFGRVRGLAR